MKTFEEIFTYDRLLKSFEECKHGQMWKGSVIDFDTNYAEKLMRLEEIILNGSYTPYPDNINFINERGRNIC